MDSDTKAVAEKIIEVIPMVMQKVASELRRTGYDLAPGHYRILAILASGAHSLSELAEKQAVSLPTMSNSISILANRGWVKRERSRLDHRTVFIEVTPAGREVLFAVRQSAEANVARFVACLSKEQCDQLRIGLKILESIFNRTQPSNSEQIVEELRLIKDGREE
ncbi:MAG TPA: MarR family transcriptional regulator [Anaerolineales bacterium]|nr:MarR family transcriptional regulator [Anaerolineales bacterium]